MPAGRPKTAAASRSVLIQCRLSPPEVAAVDRIAAEIGHGGGVPSRTAAIRWAVRELVARLELARKARGMPTVGQSGPITRP